MIRRTLVVLVGGSWLAAIAAPAVAVTNIEDCQRWMDQLQTRTGEVTITGGDEERRKLLDHVDQARGEGNRGKLRESIEKVKRFQDRAAALAAQGKVSRSEGAQLGNLSEAVRRCLEAVESGGSARGTHQPLLGD